LASDFFCHVVMNRPIWISDSYAKFGVLLLKTEFKNFLEYDSGVHMGLIHGRNRGRKSRATVPLKSCQLRKTPGGKKNI
jgi:hypothetical protein